jgi:hypothetical protein
MTVCGSFIEARETRFAPYVLQHSALLAAVFTQPILDVFVQHAGDQRLVRNAFSQRPLLKPSKVFAR